jgi:hypothetical protein
MRVSYDDGKKVQSVKDLKASITDFFSEGTKKTAQAEKGKRDTYKSV